jgi:hypothetical protein
MPSTALNTWLSESVAAFDRMEGAHGSVGGTGRGRRYFIDHLNQSYTVLVASHFQRFCRDLHSEGIDVLAQWAHGQSAELELLVRDLARKRSLDGGNANPGTIGNDFNRFGLVFWNEVDQTRHGSTRHHRLDRLNAWRNAIAHQDFKSVGGHRYLRLQEVRVWRSTCTGLAQAFDRVMRNHLRRIMSTWPW